MSDQMSFFAEGKYISGSFTVEERRNDFEEDISLSGLVIHGGIVFHFGQ